MHKIKIKPLSINKAFQGRRFKTKEHRKHEEELLWLLKGHKKVEGFYRINFVFYVKYFLRSDVSNLIKTTEDAIVKAGLVEDDRYCVEMNIRKIRSDVDFFEFEIEPIEEFEPHESKK